MKAIILILIIFSFARLAFCDITQDYVAADNKTTLTSTFNQVDYYDQGTGSAGQFDQVAFSKSEGSGFYKLVIKLTGNQEIIFSAAEIKFRGTNFELPNPEIRSRDNQTDNSVENTFTLDLSATAEPMLTAHEATLILKAPNRGSIVWGIPEYIIDEWKAIIKN